MITQQAQEIKNQLDMLKKSSNPNVMWQNMLMQNPKLKEYNDLVSSAYKGNGKEAFYAAARLKGMTDQQIEEFLAAIS